MTNANTSNTSNTSGTSDSSNNSNSSDFSEKEQKNKKNNFDEIKESIKVEMTNFIQKNPVASVALVAGIGFLLARFIYKRRL